MNGKLLHLFSWEVYEFPWGTAVKEQRTGKWKRLFLYPNGQEIDVEGIEIILHCNGIEFVM